LEPPLKVYVKDPPTIWVALALRGIKKLNSRMK